MSNTKPYCIECGCTEDDYLVFDNSRTVQVRFAKSRYGLLCQRHMRNAYQRTTYQRKARRKPQQAQTEHDRLTGQMKMFDS